MNRLVVMAALSFGVLGLAFAQDPLTIYPTSGNVGIGASEDPAPHKLGVTGSIKSSDRIYDETGLVMPVGSILPYGGGTAPQGWLLCNGDNVSRTSYADLFTIIGASFGAGDGSSTFNLPDMRGLFLRGVSAGSGRDPDASKRFASTGQQILSVDISTNYISVADATQLADGTEVILSSTDILPSPLLPNTTYFIVQQDVGGNRFKVSTTLGGTEVDILSAGISIADDAVYVQVGDVVGSRQEDALHFHYHGLSQLTVAIPGSARGDSNGSPHWSTWQTTQFVTEGVQANSQTAVATESRSANIGVNFIIKY